MGSDPKALVRSLVAVIVLVAIGMGLPARAVSPGGGHAVRVAVVEVPGPADVRVPFPATQGGLRWRGSDGAPVELRLLTARGRGPLATLALFDHAGVPAPQL